MKNADLALYRAKADGGGAYRFFELEMDARMQARRALELDLRKAVVNGEFEVYYQPIVDVKTGRVKSCEALLRWHHPERGMVPPLEFIPVAEETGLIVPIGEWVLRQACAEAARWPKQVTISVNLSPAQFKSRNLVRSVEDALDKAGLDPGRLELEITELVLLEEAAGAFAILHLLRDLGIKIAMDDFGTGYSSLGYLRSFPFDKIKIDQSFIHDLATKEDSLAIVRAVVGLSSSLRHHDHRGGRGDKGAARAAGDRRLQRGAGLSVQPGAAGRRDRADARRLDRAARRRGVIARRDDRDGRTRQDDAASVQRRARARECALARFPKIISH